MMHVLGVTLMEWRMVTSAFGPTYNGPNRSNVNIQVGVRHYLVQMNWDPQLQACAQA